MKIRNLHGYETCVHSRKMKRNAWGNDNTEYYITYEKEGKK